jgi:hypothetical protein
MILDLTIHMFDDTVPTSTITATASIVGRGLGVKVAIKAARKKQQQSSERRNSGRNFYLNGSFIPTTQRSHQYH